MASTANGDDAKTHKGDSFLIAGVTWQVFTLTVFAVMLVLYIIRRRNAYKNEGMMLDQFASDTLQDTKFRLFCLGVLIAFTCIFIRCIYRVAELAGGFGNPIMRNETLFIVLEGA